MKKFIGFAFLVLGVGVGVGAMRAEVTDLSCVQTGPTEYHLSYRMTADTHQVDISASVDPEGRSEKLVLLKTGETNITLHAGKLGERVYFFLQPDHGKAREVSIRRLPLEGTPNFRDLGGYETTDGHFVKWGMIYRSGVLTNLNPMDFAYLSQAGIRVVCDFRTAQENSVAPEVWIPNSDVKHVSLPIGPSKDADKWTQTMLADNPSAAQLKHRMTAVYEGFVFNNAPEYAAVFQQLEHDPLPLLYHCTAGKDRTGVFSALLLRVLGVPETTLLEDYEMTNTYLRDGKVNPTTQQTMTRSSPGLATLTPEQRQVLMNSDPDYLTSTFQGIDERFGSFDEYRKTQLHLSDEDVKKLRSRLLEN